MRPGNRPCFSPARIAHATASAHAAAAAAFGVAVSALRRPVGEPPRRVGDEEAPAPGGGGGGACSPAAARSVDVLWRHMESCFSTAANRLSACRALASAECSARSSEAESICEVSAKATACLLLALLALPLPDPALLFGGNDSGCCCCCEDMQNEQLEHLQYEQCAACCAALQNGAHALNLKSPDFVEAQATDELFFAMCCCRAAIAFAGARAGF